MKRIMVLALCGVLLLSTGCGKKGPEGEVVTEGLGGDYNVTDYVQTGKYEGIDICLIENEITEDEIEFEISDLLQEHAEKEDITDGMKQDDSALIDFDCYIDGKKVDELCAEYYEFILGYCYLTEDVDRALLGANVGDEVSVDTILEGYIDEYDGKNATYKITVQSAYREVMPELTDAWVKENTESESVEDLKVALRKKLEEEYAASSVEKAQDDALILAMGNATFQGYPEEEYQEVYDELRAQYEVYAEWYEMELEDLITEEELVEYAIEQTQEAMFVQAVAKEQKITFTKAEMDEILKQNLDYWGVESLEELYDYFTMKELSQDTQRRLVSKWIYEHANVLKVSQAEYEEIYGIEDHDEEEAEVEG